MRFAGSKCPKIEGAWGYNLASLGKFRLDFGRRARKRGGKRGEEKENGTGKERGREEGVLMLPDNTDCTEQYGVIYRDSVSSYKVHADIR